MSDYDRDHVGRVMREGDWFTARLFRLFHQADSENKARLALSFPDEAAAYQRWLHHGDVDDAAKRADEEFEQR